MNGAHDMPWNDEPEQQGKTDITKSKYQQHHLWKTQVFGSTPCRVFSQAEFEFWASLNLPCILKSDSSNIGNGCDAHWP